MNKRIFYPAKKCKSMKQCSLEKNNLCAESFSWSLSFTPLREVFMKLSSLPEAGVQERGWEIGGTDVANCTHGWSADLELLPQVFVNCCGCQARLKILTLTYITVAFHPYHNFMRLAA